jgi:cytochrome c oxidase assembly protein Cox11
MIRFRNLAIVAVIATAIYALTPATRKARFFDKVREFGRALVLSLVLYWLLILGRAWFAG